MTTSCPGRLDREEDKLVAKPLMTMSCILLMKATLKLTKTFFIPHNNTPFLKDVKMDYCAQISHVLPSPLHPSECDVRVTKFDKPA